MDEDRFTMLREAMVAEIFVGAMLMAEQLGRDAFDERVLAAMARVPRHEFVPLELQPYAYMNRPLAIGYDKTVSNPLIIAVMTDMLDIQPGHTVLEVGTGLGYLLRSWPRSRSRSTASRSSRNSPPRRGRSSSGSASTTSK